MKTTKKLLDLLTPHERRRAVLLVGMILVMALLDTIGVASIMPFIAVLSNPQIVESNTLLASVQNTVGLSDRKEFLFFLGVVVFVLLVVSLAFKALTTYAQVRFTLMREYSIGKRLIAGYLHQPYAWFLNRHSADLGKTILSEVSIVVCGGIAPFMTLIAQCSVAIALSVLVFLVDPLLSITVYAVLGTAYLLIYKLMSKFLARIGQERVKANKLRFIAVSEAFGAAKIVKIGGLEQVYISRFAHPAETYAKHQASANVVKQFPRFVLEAISFGGLLLVMLHLMADAGGSAKALPVIALYAFAGYRLMPALQQIYGSFSSLRFVGPSLDALHADLTSLKHVAQGNKAAPRMQLEQAIRLRNIQFSYDGAKQPALRGIDLEIPARNTIGLVGPTGSSKTTLVDLILGLIEPQQGSITVDGIDIDDSNRRQWQKSIGYVPQEIYLADASIAANIAFGVEPALIDYDAIWRVAKIANLHDFIVNELPKQYETAVGERGIRLSGGQRQRIGIARALFHNPEVLILDEATSALDNLTEQAVMEAVNNLGHDITIIMIAHRLSTVRLCNKIYLMSNGQIEAQGSYDQLIHESRTFKALAAK